MKRAKKIDEISYGVRTKLAVGGWTDEEAAIIRNIQSTYKFENYNLLDKLLEKMNAISGIPEIIKSNPSEKEQLAYINELELNSQWLSELISPGKMGKIIRGRIFNHLENGSSMFEDLAKILKQLHPACIKSLIEIRHEQLKFVEGSPKRRLPKNDETDKIKSLIKPLLSCLCEVFKEGSALPSTHGTNHYPDNCPSGYKGNLYEFIMEVSPILKKKLGINIGTPKVIGRYLNDVRPKVKKA